MKPHRTDGVSLIFALIFLAVAGWWLIAQVVDLALPAVGWFVAGGLILLRPARPARRAALRADGGTAHRRSAEIGLAHHPHRRSRRARPPTTTAPAGGLWTEESSERSERATSGRGRLTEPVRRVSGASASWLSICWPVEALPPPASHAQGVRTQ